MCYLPEIVSDFSECQDDRPDEVARKKDGGKVALSIDSAEKVAINKVDFGPSIRFNLQAFVCLMAGIGIAGL